MRIITFFLSLLLLQDLGLPAITRDEVVHRKALVLAHVTIIDVTGGAAKPDMTVVVTDQRISSIGNSAMFITPKDAEVIDARGKFLIPGLWDMHVHTWSRDNCFPLYLVNGVTGVRDLYSPRTISDFSIIDGWRQQIESGKILGPRIVATGLNVNYPPSPRYLAAGNEAEGRRAVTALKQQGADFVKVYSGLPRDAYFAIADEAKKQRMPFAGHVPDSITAAEASDAGQKSIEHLNGVVLGSSTREEGIMNEPLSLSKDIEAFESYSNAKAEALFARFVKNKTWQCPTLVEIRAAAFANDDRVINDSRLKYISTDRKNLWEHWFPPNRSEEEYQILRRSFEIKLGFIRPMRRAGVEFLAGTDTGAPDCFPGFSLHDELELLVTAGLTPLEALQTATINPARFLNRENDLGSVETGKFADLVLLDANPLIDIGDTRKIFGVVVNGQYLSKPALQKMLDAAEAIANRK